MRTKGGHVLRYRLLATLLVITGTVRLCSGQSATAPDPQLFRQISELDTKLFEAYNRCQLEQFGRMVSDDIEFYHDKTGLSVGKPKLLDAWKQNICSKVTRELLPASLEVYPLEGYGAVEIGVHRFRHTLEGNKVAGEAKFVHLWQHTAAGWKLTRVISFDHQEAK
jgi:ketosteroid isomerase-like protein